MIIVVYRAAAVEFDVDGFLARHPALKPATVWRVGEKRRLAERGVETSGFSLSPAEGDDFEDVLSRTRRALEELSAAQSELRSLGVETDLDFGLMTVGSEKTFIQSVSFPPEALAWFRERGLTLCVTAYPCSDGDE
jgi:hypothetical protein